MSTMHNMMKMSWRRTAVLGLVAVGLLALIALAVHEKKASAVETNPSTPNPARPETVTLEEIIARIDTLVQQRDDAAADSSRPAVQLRRKEIGKRSLEGEFLDGKPLILYFHFNEGRRSVAERFYFDSGQLVFVSQELFWDFDEPQPGRDNERWTVYVNQGQIIRQVRTTMDAEPPARKTDDRARSAAAWIRRAQGIQTILLAPESHPEIPPELMDSIDPGGGPSMDMVVDIPVNLEERAGQNSRLRLEKNEPLSIPEIFWTSHRRETVRDLVVFQTRQRWPLYIEYDPADRRLLDVVVCTPVRVERLTHQANGDLHVTLHTKPSYYSLSRQHPRFESLSRRLDAAQRSGESVFLANDPSTLDIRWVEPQSGFSATP